MTTRDVRIRLQARDDASAIFAKTERSARSMFSTMEKGQRKGGFFDTSSAFGAKGSLMPAVMRFAGVSAGLIEITSALRDYQSFALEAARAGKTFAQAMEEQRKSILDFLPVIRQGVELGRQLTGDDVREAFADAQRDRVEQQRKQLMAEREQNQKTLTGMMQKADEELRQAERRRQIAEAATEQEREQLMLSHAMEDSRRKLIEELQTIDQLSDRIASDAEKQQLREKALAAEQARRRELTIQNLRAIEERQRAAADAERKRSEAALDALFGDHQQSLARLQQARRDLMAPEGPRAATMVEGRLLTRAPGEGSAVQRTAQATATTARLAAEQANGINRMVGLLERIERGSAILSIGDL